MLWCVFWLSLCNVCTCVLCVLSTRCCQRQHAAHMHHHTQRLGKTLEAEDLQRRIMEQEQMIRNLRQLQAHKAKKAKVCVEGARVCGGV